MADVKMIDQRVYITRENVEFGDDVFVLVERKCMLENGDVRCLTAAWWSEFSNEVDNEIVTHVTSNSLFDLFIHDDDGRTPKGNIKQTLETAWSQGNQNYMKEQYPKQYAEMTAVVKKASAICGCKIG